MTPEEATRIAHVMCQMWPAPELTEDGVRMLVVALVDTRLTAAEAETGVRLLMQQDHPFRPQPFALKHAARPRTVEYHRPFADTAGALPAAPVDRAVGRAALAEMRRALGTAVKRVDDALAPDGAA